MAHRPASRQRVCEFCRAALPADAPPQSRYCCRSHRQRAYEARQAEEVTQLRREVRRLHRQVAERDAFIDRLSEHPRYGKDVTAAYLGMLEEKVQRRADARAERLRQSTT
jgi:hypothetical protein